MDTLVHRTTGGVEFYKGDNDYYDAFSARKEGKKVNIQILGQLPAEDAKIINILNEVGDLLDNQVFLIMKPDNTATATLNSLMGRLTIFEPDGTIKGKALYNFDIESFKS